MLRHLHRPARRRHILKRRRDAREVIAIGIEGVVRIVVHRGLAGLRLILLHAVYIQNAVLQVNPVARQPYRPLHQKQVLIGRLEEDNHVPAANIAVVHKRRPLRLRGQRDAIHHHVVADQQRRQHRPRRNLEVLEDEGRHKQHQHQHRADRGDGLVDRLAVLLCDRTAGIRASGRPASRSSYRLCFVRRHARRQVRQHRLPVSSSVSPNRPLRPPCGSRTAADRSPQRTTRIMRSHRANPPIAPSRPCPAPACGEAACTSDSRPFRAPSPVGDRSAGASEK